MPHESQITQLARSAIRAHGTLQEIIFLQENNDSLLVFADGTVLPTSYAERGDARWTTIVQAAKTYPYLDEVARQLEGKNPLSLLTFGNSEMGPQGLATFLRVAEFKHADIANITPPLKLRADGTQVRGAWRGELIEWENGSDTPDVGIGKLKETETSLRTSVTGAVISQPKVKKKNIVSQPISTKSDTIAHTGFWKSGLIGKLALGCGGLSGLLAVCVICGALLGSEGTSQTVTEGTSTTSPTVAAKVATAIPTPKPPTLIPSPSPVPPTPTSTSIPPITTPTPVPPTPTPPIISFGQAAEHELWKIKVIGLEQVDNLSVVPDMNYLANEGRTIYLVVLELENLAETAKTLVVDPRQIEVVDTGRKSHMAIGSALLGSIPFK